MATSLDINDLVQIFQNSNLDDLAKSKLEKLKNEQNKWQAEILNKWANLKIPVYSKADIRLLNDAVYNDTKKKNQARAKLREYYLRRGQLNAAAAVNDLPENSKSGKNCIMQEGKKTLGWEPNLTEWIVIENDTRTISISEFQNCIESCEFSQALNIPISIDKLLKEAEINGFSEDQIKELFLDFIKQFKPASLLTARTFSDSANEIIQFLISLVNTPSEVQKVREALKKISREPSTELIDSILKVKSLTSTLLLLNNPKSDRQRIDKRSTTAALDAIFDLVNNQVQEGLRMFKQRATETERDVTINSLVSEALRLEAIHGKPQESKYVSQKIQHADSLSSYFTYDRIGEGKRSRDRHFSREQSKDRRFSSKDRNSGNSNEGRGSSRDRRFSGKENNRGTDRSGERGSDRSRGTNRSKERSQSFNKERGKSFERNKSPGDRQRFHSKDRNRSQSRDRSLSPRSMKRPSPAYFKEPEELNSSSSRSGNDEQTDSLKGRVHQSKNCQKCGSKSHFSSQCQRYPYFTKNQCKYCNLFHPNDLCRFKPSRYVTPDRDTVGEYSRQKN